VSTWLIWWFVLALLTTLVIVVVIVGLVRQALVLGRAARRFQDEVAPLADQISGEADRASAHATRLRPPGLGRGRRG
jgi:Flp pilus assembly protein TadB